MQLEAAAQLKASLAAAAARGLVAAQVVQLYHTEVLKPAQADVVELRQAMGS